jgi:Concanavalin A-like lectin/glucanases superfamily
MNTPPLVVEVGWTHTLLITGNPSAGPLEGALGAQFTMGGGASTYIYVDMLSVPDYVVATNDELWYEVRWDTGGVAGSVTDGGFEVGISGWSKVAITNITAGTSGTLTHGTTFPRTGTGHAQLTVFPSPPTDNGISFFIDGVFQSGVMYTATVWFRRVGGVHALARVRLGHSASNDKATSASTTVTTSYVQHTVSWTPSANRTGAHLAFLFDNQDVGTSTVVIDDVSLSGTVLPNTNKQIALDFTCSDATNLRTVNPLDQNGKAAHPTTDLSAQAAGVWYFRQFSLTGFIGKTIQFWDVACENDTAGVYQAYFRNIVVFNPVEGRLKHFVWNVASGNVFLQTHINVGTHSYLISRHDPVATWTDESDRIETVSTRHGRSNELERVGPGTLELALQNRDRRYEPDYSGSPLYPNVTAGKEIRVRVPRYHETTTGLGGVVGQWLLDDSSLSSTALAKVGPNGTYSSGTGRSTPLITGDAPTYEGSAAIDGAGGWGWCRDFGIDALGVDMGDVLDFTGTAPFTLEAWIRPTTIDTQFRRIIGKHFTPDGYALTVQLISSQTRLSFLRQNSAGFEEVQVNGLLATNVIYHVVATYDGSAMRVYVNSALVGGPVTSTRSLIDITEQFRIGHIGGGTARFLGKIDEPTVYARALSADEVAYQYRRGKSGWHAHLFRGYIDDIQNEWEGRTGTAQITATDGFSVLDAKKISGYRPLEFPDDRITWALDQAGGWPQLRRSLDAGTDDIEASWSVTGTLLDNDPALAHMLDVAEADLGLVFISRSGVFTYRDRNSRVGAISQATYSDNPGTGEYLYIGIEPVFETDLIYNEIRVRPVAAVTDAVQMHHASQGAYGPRTHDRVVWLTTLPAAADQAETLLSKYAFPAMRFRQLTLDIKRVDDDADLVTIFPNWGAAIGRSINDKITVERQPPGGGSAMVKSAFVEGVQHDARSRGAVIEWRTILVLSPAT